MGRVDIQKRTQNYTESKKQAKIYRESPARYMDMGYEFEEHPINFL